MITHREREILSLASEGKTNKLMAYELKVSEQTIKNHMSHLMRKLGATSRTDAVLIAARRGYIDVAMPIGGGEPELADDLFVRLSEYEVVLRDRVVHLTRQAVALGAQADQIAAFLAAVQQLPGEEA